MFSFFESENALLCVEDISEFIFQLFEVPNVLVNLKGDGIHVFYILLLKVTCLVSLVEDKSPLLEDGVGRVWQSINHFSKADALIKESVVYFYSEHPLKKVKWGT